MMSHPQIQRHLEAFPLNQGITSASLYVIIDSIFKFQKERRIHGDLMEIGVLHGATSGYLSLFLERHARLILIDPYQDLQKVAASIIDFSGIESTCIFCLPEDSRRVYKLRSLFLDSLLLGCQIVHIDGEHSYDAVVNDIRLAELYLLEGGLIIVDDIFNVASACCTHALFDAIAAIPNLHIACIGLNKAFVCDSRYLDAYRSFFLRLPEELSSTSNVYIRACLNDWSRERGYISIHEIQKGDPKYQGINKVTDDLNSLFDS